MAIVHTTGIKFNFDVPYMSVAERAAFRALEATGVVTFYRKSCCPCGTDIPKGKTFCSQTCYAKSQEDSDGSEEAGDADG